MNNLAGYTYPHEHITIDLSGPKRDTDCHLDCFEETAAELRQLYSKGVRNIIDVTNRGMGRNIPYLLRMEQATGLHILCATGWYKEPFLPAEVGELPVEALANILIRELTEGIDGLKKASVIGEIGSSLREITPLEQKIFEAAAIAHKATGAPIITHTTLGELAYEQLEIFNRYTVDLSKVIISHTALKGDYDYIEGLAKAGVNIAFDTVGKTSYQPDELRIDFLCRLAEAGYAGQLLMSMDITRKSHLKVNGGVGYSYLMDSFTPMLLKRGLPPATLEQIMSGNINRILGGTT
ncbi:MAG: phosphotriesterase-related protein [Angelakisella sp.]